MIDLLRVIIVMTLSGSILSLLLFGLKPLIRDRLPKSAQYYLWLIVLGALLIPNILPISNPLPITSPINETVSKYMVQKEELLKKELQEEELLKKELQQEMELQKDELHQEEADRIQPTAVTTGQTESYSAPVRAVRHNPLSVAISVFAAVYPFGVLLVVLYYFINYVIVSWLYCQRNYAAQDEEITLLAEYWHKRRIPRLYRNPLASTPMLMGIFRTVIILPDRKYTKKQMQYILIHELTHLQRKDILVRWSSVMACAIHWFNPIIWMVRRETERACELACDEAVIRNLDFRDRQGYGDTLIYVAADSKISDTMISVTMCEEKKVLKERLEAIMKNKKYTHLAVAASVMLMAAAIAVTLFLSSDKGNAGQGNSNVAVQDVDITLYSNNNIDKTVDNNKTAEVNSNIVNTSVVHIDLDQGFHMSKIPVEGSIYNRSDNAYITAPVQVTVRDEDMLSRITVDDIEICWYPVDDDVHFAYRKPGGEWTLFLREDMPYHGGYWVTAYNDLFGHSGFSVIAQQSSSYASSQDYYYFDKNGDLKMLYEGRSSDIIGDFNGDGKNELISSGNNESYLGYIYYENGQKYRFHASDVMEKLFPGMEIRQFWVGANVSKTMVSAIEKNLNSQNYLIEMGYYGQDGTYRYGFIEFTPEEMIIYGYDDFS